MINKSKILLSFIALALIISFSACDDWVQELEVPPEIASDDALNTPKDVPVFVTGVLTRFAMVWDETSNFADGLSDALEFTRDIQQATFPTFEAIDLAEEAGVNPLLPTNNSTEDIFGELAELRLHADTLVERVMNRITFEEGDEAIKNLGLYTGYYYGAVARFMWGAYWGLNRGDNGGGVINVSPFIPSTQMYSDALDLLDQALAYANANQVKEVNSLKARILLIQGNYTEASTAAGLGYAMGDAGSFAKYSSIENNMWHYWSGLGRSQWHAADRFGTYVYEDPTESARLPQYQIAGVNPFTAENDTVIAGVAYTAGEEVNRIYIQQLKYDNLDSDIQFLSWQENYLIMAEAAIRGNDYVTGMGYINDIRGFYGVTEMTDDMVTNDFGGNYLEMLYVERDKTLAFQGLRVLDQRRFDKWHLNKATTWQFFPIIQDERDVNPNFD